MRFTEIIAEAATAEYLRPVPSAWGATTAVGLFAVNGRTYAISSAFSAAEAQQYGINLSRAPDFTVGAEWFGMDGAAQIPAYIAKQPKGKEPGWAVAVRFSRR